MRQRPDREGLCLDAIHSTLVVGGKLVDIIFYDVGAGNKPVSCDPCVFNLRFVFSKGPSRKHPFIAE